MTTRILTEAEVTELRWALRPQGDTLVDSHEALRARVEELEAGPLASVLYSRIDALEAENAHLRAVLEAARRIRDWLMSKELPSFEARQCLEDAIAAYDAAKEHTE